MTYDDAPIFSSGAFTAVALSPRDVIPPDHWKNALAQARLGIGSGVVAVENGGRETVLLVPAARAHRVDALVAWLLAEQGELAIGIGSPGVTAERGVRESLACARLARIGDRGSRAIFVRSGSASCRSCWRWRIPGTSPSSSRGASVNSFGMSELGLPPGRDAAGVPGPRRPPPDDRAGLHIHTSTVKYRLARLAEALGRPLQDPDVRFELRMAVEIADFLGPSWK